MTDADIAPPILANPWYNAAMSKFFLKLLCFLVVVLTLTTLGAQPTHAQTNNSRQVLVKEDNGAMYLTTELNPNEAFFAKEEATVSASIGPNSSPLPRRTATSIQEIEVQVPRGFAASFSGLINGILSFVLVIAAVLVLVFLLWGGFDWIISGGDKGKTEQARSKIVSAVIGLVIVAASFAILNLVIRFLGFTSLNDVFDSAGTIQGGAQGPRVSPTPGVTPTPIVTPTPVTAPTLIPI